MTTGGGFVVAKAACYATVFVVRRALDREGCTTCQEALVKGDLKMMETFVLDAAHDYQYDGTNNWKYDWTLPKALLFTISIMTTIGYGHIAPRTSRGQIFTIFYALIATPLLLVFLTKIGDSMATGFTTVYSRICCRWCRSRRYKAEALFGKKVKRVSDDVVGQEEYMPTKNVHVPTTVLLVVLMLYLWLGAEIFSNWEGWNRVAAGYFSFVTLGTIGFGDLVPGHRYVQMHVQRTQSMALISMCIQMMQEEMMTKAKWMAEEFGLAEDGRDARVPYRVSRTDTVWKTPNGAEGNTRQSTARQEKLPEQVTCTSDEWAESPVGTGTPSGYPAHMRALKLSG
ncbi:TWiK family of potassium channels protein 7-like [Pollicipes pollicipes]|uniref:TWiK family of potassium channels protein 7-like n=1 Tax=Pollicipes pollicipes TaxID=41117 RepID=UPI0018858923|nr:TWiK family of potassium channels protein 7-like [Pollicipes pollicipes]